MYQISGSALWHWRSRSRQQAIAHQVSPDEVDWVLLRVSDLDRLALRLGTVQTRTTVSLGMPLAELDQRWQHRLRDRSPIQYVTGKAPWREFDLVVSPAVLIPRPETEQLIDLALLATRDPASLQRGHWADLGTGSGAIALGLASAFPQAHIHAVDASQDALAIAQQNAQRYAQKKAQPIQFHQGSWFEPLQEVNGQLCGVVSNPPYIPTASLKGLSPEVRHDPSLALDGGKDGLDAIRTLVADAPDYLVSGGVWLVETMMGQPPAVVELLRKGPYRDIQVFTDLAGIDRFVMARRS
ncbi:MAG: peptide chain release factor N(5)-glutamine methyltransferase [Elainellaceae cyanobacterium]